MVATECCPLKNNHKCSASTFSRNVKSIECHTFVGYQSFENITQDKEVISKLEQLYHDINNVDLWVGGLAEEHQKGELGPTFKK